MRDLRDQFEDCEVIILAIKPLAEILLPYMSDRPELQRAVEQVQSAQSETAYYPVRLLLDLLFLAEEKGILERVAENRALSSLPFLLVNEQIESPRDVLSFFARMLSRQHRGNPGDLSVRMTDERKAEVNNGTYLPCAYLIPLLRRTMAGFGAKQVTVNHPSKNCREQGAARCKMTFSWDADDLLRIRQKK